MSKADNRVKSPGFYTPMDIAPGEYSKPQANKTIDDKQKFVDAMHNYFGLQDLNDLEYWGDVYDSVVQALVTEVRVNERQAMLDTAINYKHKSAIKLRGGEK